MKLNPGRIGVLLVDNLADSGGDIKYTLDRATLSLRTEVARRSLVSDQSLSKQFKVTLHPSCSNQFFILPYKGKNDITRSDITRCDIIVLPALPGML